jgi:putative oxidoreductase
LSEKEHGLLFLIPYVAILLIGAGKYSLDESLYKKRRF